ncbi:MAG: heparinase II/III family protein [Acidobacteria bacterium]|nr:heparinase II/III family protein [Acidobacteriota bacterium]
MNGAMNEGGRPRAGDDDQHSAARPRDAQPASAVRDQRTAPRLPKLIQKILPPSRRAALRGEVRARDLAPEALLRLRRHFSVRRERAGLARGEEAPRAARLRAEFAALSPPELLAHFRARATPRLPDGLEAEPEESAHLSRERFPRETDELIARALQIVEADRWSLLGCGEFDFGGEVDWLRDPLSGARWSRGFFADVKLFRGDGSDARVLWELNRLAHLVALGQAYAVTSDERLAEKFFAHVEGWRAQNPVARGANWASAMEVALRAANLLAALRLFRRSPLLDERKLSTLLATLDEHGEFVRAHLEFSHLATSNHYLSNVVGLLWLGVLLPELEAARGWREFGLAEMLGEMDRQVLADGAHYESSTGYHRLVAEMLLYSFALCRANGIMIEEKYWSKLRAMLGYTRAYLRPDLSAPLVGDTDGGRFLPLSTRAADEHAYVVQIGAAVFDEPRFKLEARPPFELLWLLGEDGLRAYENVTAGEPTASSAAFACAGTYVLRDADLYLLMSASGAGARGRGSHAHNDALSVEVSACGSNFVVDPGTYVYTADLAARHEFRSTAHHSTVEVDGAEQNETDERAPFRIGDDARPRLLRWSAGDARDLAIAEHRGYERLPAPVTHARAVLLDKRRRFFLVEDTFAGTGSHTFRFRFHAGRAVAARVREGGAELYDDANGARLFVVALDADAQAAVEARSTSRDYGERAPSQSLCWTLRAGAPLRVAWALVPVGAGEDEGARLAETVGVLRATSRDKWLKIGE